MTSTANKQPLRKRSIKYNWETKGINIIELAKICGVSATNMYLIDRSKEMRVYPETVQKIYFGTKKKFNDPLRPAEYLAGYEPEAWC